MAMLPDDDADLAFQDLLRAAVGEIVRHEDYDRLVAWLRDDAAHEFPGALPPGEPAMMAAMAAGLGRSIWNATPLPGNGFRPRPRPAPGRNDPCPCGSGRKFKQCCAGMPEFPPIEADEMWALLAYTLGSDQLRQAIEQRRIPPAALVYAAERLFDDQHPRRAADLLEPVFAGPLGHLDERFEPHLDLLCDIYLELDHPRKKQALLERVIAEAPRTLAAAAWHRVATARADAGDREGCWEAFRSAQRADPEHPALATLEVTLLVSEGRAEMASERAAFWLARLRRRPDVPDQALAFLERVAQDANAALFEAGASATGIQDAERLVRWLDSVAGRPLPAYTLIEPPPLDTSDPQALAGTIESVLRKMGLPEREARREARKEARRLAKEHEEAAAATAQGRLFDDEEPEAAGADPRPLRFVHAPENLEPVEAGWHGVFPFDKPFLADSHDLDPDAVWSPDTAPAWLAYLERHPECFDSLDILDDLAGAVASVIPGRSWPGAGGPLEGVLDRGCAILRTVAGESDPLLEWAAMDNRPALRLIAMRAQQALARRDDGAALADLSWLMRLNPNDNHGYRALAINLLLRRGDDEAALALAARYPDDAMPEIAFGRVLALYRRGEQQAARLALDEAWREQPWMVPVLVRPRARRARFDVYGVVPGSEDEALLYREAMRDVWAATPGLFDWLQPASRSRQPGKGPRAKSGAKARRRPRP